MEQQIELKQRLLGMAHDKYKGLQGYSKVIRFGLGWVLRSLPLMAALLLGQQAWAAPQACAAGEMAQTFSFPAGIWTNGSLGPLVSPVATGGNTTNFTVSITPNPAVPQSNAGVGGFPGPYPRQWTFGNVPFTVFAASDSTPAGTTIATFNLGFNRQVNKLSFTAVDISSDNPLGGAQMYRDFATFAANNGTALLPTAITSGNGPGGYHVINLGAGTAEAADPLAGPFLGTRGTANPCGTNINTFCNVAVDFSQSGITSASLTYAQSSAFVGTEFQFVGLNDISWCLPPSTVTITAVSNGGVGPFTYTGGNGYPGETLTTTAPATGAPGTTQTLTTSATGTTITETIPTGYTLTGVNCTGLGAGGTATPNLAAGSVTLDVAATTAGSNIACTFTNTATPPTVTVSTITNGGTVGVPYTGTNGVTNFTNTTVTPGVAVTGPIQSLTTASSSTVVTEAIPPGYVLTGATCTGLGTGGTATPNLAAGTVTLDAAATAAGSNIACTFTNAKLPTVTVSTVSNGGTGGFPYTGTNGVNNFTNTTVTAGTPVTGPVQTLTAVGTSTVVTESIPPGFVLTGATCTGLGAGGTATPNLAAGTVTLDAAATAAGSNIACTFTHNRLPTVTVSTITNGGTAGVPYTGTNGVNNFTNTTVTSGVPVTGPVQTLTTSGTSTVVSETIPPGFTLTGATCTGLTPGGTATPNLATGTITLDAVATAGSPNIACTFTHSAPATVAINVISNGGVGPFGFTGTNGVTNQTLTTVTPGTGVQGPVQSVTTVGSVT
ncbi:beta strand repeat-containing protein, partial [Chitinimonas sp. PSY-7]|uniref:prealbumin-like fold domain-containing protein n=3 Tax=Chitinimonas sp. PSY-7 TaxID=3459088 RepID=UPI00403FEE3C